LSYNCITAHRSELGEIFVGGFSVLVSAVQCAQDTVKMFKKERDLTIRSKTLLKNKETRTLLTEVLKQYPSLTEEVLHDVIPKKASITVAKLASRTLVYIVDSVPMLFDKDDRNQLFPTVFMLWRLPSMMRQVLIRDQVSGFVLKGADLMLAGVNLLTGTTSYLD
jgi:translation initiation factor 2D